MQRITNAETTRWLRVTVSESGCKETELLRIWHCVQNEQQETDKDSCVGVTESPNKPEKPRSEYTIYMNGVRCMIFTVSLKQRRTKTVGSDNSGSSMDYRYLNCRTDDESSGRAGGDTGRQAETQIAKCECCLVPRVCQFSPREYGTLKVVDKSVKFY